MAMLNSQRVIAKKCLGKCHEMIRTSNICRVLGPKKWISVDPVEKLQSQPLSSSRPSFWTTPPRTTARTVFPRYLGRAKIFFFCRRFHVAVSMVDLSSTKLRMLWKSMGSGWFSKSMSACLLLGKTIRHQRIEEKPILGENHVRLDVHLWESCHQVCWLKF